MEAMQPKQQNLHQISASVVCNLFAKIFMREIHLPTGSSEFGFLVPSRFDIHRIGTTDPSRFSPASWHFWDWNGGAIAISPREFTYVELERRTFGPRTVAPLAEAGEGGVADRGAARTRGPAPASEWGSYIWATNWQCNAGNKIITMFKW